MLFSNSIAVNAAEKINMAKEIYQYAETIEIMSRRPNCVFFQTPPELRYMMLDHLIDPNFDKKEIKKLAKTYKP